MTLRNNRRQLAPSIYDFDYSNSIDGFDAKRRLGRIATAI